MKRRSRFGVLVAAALVFTACQATSTPSASISAGPSASISAGPSGSISGADGDLAKAKVALTRPTLPAFASVPDIGTVKTKGTVGEPATWFTDVSLTDAQLTEIRGKNLTAAFLNWDDSSYNQAILAGARDALAAMNIKLVATTNYSFDATKLAASALNIAALQPNIVFYSGIDPVSDVQALKPLTDLGASVVSYANAPGGWTTGTPPNFVTLISYDTYRMGAVVADAIHDKYPDGAKIGMIYFDATYKLVNEREKGFTEELAKYPNLVVVSRQPMTDPSKTEQITTGMLARNPEINVIFAPWDLPATGVDAALQGLNRSDVAVATIDLGFTGVKDMACGGPVFVESSQLVYEWGRSGAIAAALHALGQAVPPYVIVPVFAVTKANLADGWNLAYEGQVPLPPEVKKCLGQ